MKTVRVTESPAIAPWLRFSQGKGSISTFFQKSGVGFYSLHASGRAALYEGLKTLGCSRYENVLVPAYICDTATFPLRKLGMQIRFYNILASLEPDMADVFHKVDDKTKAIMAVNYFGFPQNLTPVRDLCAKRRIILIEDNSHGIFSAIDSRLLGTFGDVGFSSIYKELPTPNGGVLFINNDEFIPETPGSLTAPGSSSISDGFFFFSSMFKYLETKYGIPTWIIRNAYRKTHPTGESIGDKAISLEAKISRITLEAMKKLNPEDIISRRRSNYECWLKKLDGRKGIKIPYESLTEGVCPWVFPVIVEESNLIEEIRSRGVACSSWPTLPPEVQGNHDYANYLSRHLFILPVHQYVNQKYLS